jgi:hypothetical protein
MEPERVEAASATVAVAARRKPGRPRKHPVRVKGSRGRPPGPARLRDDPDRYTIACLIARWVIAPTTARLELARDIAQLNACSINSRAGAEVFANALAEGRKVRLDAKAGTPTAIGDQNDHKRWRNKDWTNARGEKLWRKTGRVLRNLRDTDDATSDQNWLCLMVDAWLVVFDVCEARLAVLALDDARALAAKAGEAEYFDDVMMRYVRTAFRVAPLFFAI